MGHPTAALNSHKYWLAFSRFSIWVKFLCLELRKQRYRKFQSLIVACSLPVSCISRLSRFHTIPPLCFSQISLSLSLLVFAVASPPLSDLTASRIAQTPPSIGPYARQSNEIDRGQNEQYKIEKCVFQLEQFLLRYRFCAGFFGEPPCRLEVSNSWVRSNFL